MKCSIVILNWNGAKLLPMFLPSVIEHSDKDNEIIVADNGSTDDSLAILRQYPSVQVMELQQNYGFAEGYNRAIASIDSEYVVLLNSDVEVTDQWLNPLLAYMDEHKDVAAVQPKIRSYRRRAYFEHAGAAGGMINCLGYPYCRGRKLRHVEEDKGQYNTEADIFWASGACMLVRTAVYKALGGLDESFFCHMEEIDLCWRIHTAGYRIVCLPQSVVYHLGGASLDYSNPRKTYFNFRNNLLMLYKNLNGVRFGMVMTCRFILDYVAVLFFLVQGKSGDAKAVIQARHDYQKMKKKYK